MTEREASEHEAGGRGPDRPMRGREWLQSQADHRNANMDAAAKARGCVWYVTRAGELRLDVSREATAAISRRIERRRESERARFARRQMEALREVERDDTPIDWEDK